MTGLVGKVAIVTGAGSGIGEQCARLMATRGAKVVVATSRRESAEPVVEAIRAAGGEAAAYYGDVADEAVAAGATSTAIETFGRLDILVNNAALTDPAFMNGDTSVDRMEAHIWRRTLDVNLIGPALLCKHALPWMVKSHGGSVVMISSGRGVQGDLGLPAYGASKAGMINLALNVAAQYGKQGVRANSVVVGMVMTPAVKKSLSSDMIAILRSHHLTPEIGTPGDIAEVVAFLASDAARFVTGAVLAADGGITSHNAAYADFLKLYSNA